MRSRRTYHPSMRRLLVQIMPLVITVALLALLLRAAASAMPPSDTGELLSGISVRWLLAGFSLYLLVSGVRARRFHALMPDQAIAPLALMPVAFALSFLNNVLPMRGGELGFVLLMRRSYGVAATKATAVIGLARLFDILAVVLLFVPTAIWALASGRLPDQVDWPVPGLPSGLLIAAGAGLAILGAGVLVSLSWSGRRVTRAFRATSRRLRLERLPAADRVLDFLTKTAEALRYFGDHGRRGKVLLQSLALWTLIFGWQYCMVRSLGGLGHAVGFEQIGLGLFIVGATFGVISSSLPVPALGGRGVVEAGLSLGFISLGLMPSLAIAGSLGIALLTLLMSALMGGGSLLWLSRRR